MAVVVVRIIIIPVPTLNSAVHTYSTVRTPSGGTVIRTFFQMGNNDYLPGAGTPPHWGLCLYLDVTSFQWSDCIVVQY